MMDEAPEGWRTLIKIPLPMAFITRYLWGTDKIRYFFPVFHENILENQFFKHKNKIFHSIFSSSLFLL